MDENIRRAEERGNCERSDRLQAARAAVAELIEDRRILAEALQAVEDTFQPTTGPLGIGRYSFPANGATANLVGAALARVGGAQ